MSHTRCWWKRQSGFKTLECGLLGIVNWRLWKMESFHGYRMPEFEVLKVAALKLFHPTVSSVLFRTGLDNLDMILGERER